MAWGLCVMHTLGWERGREGYFIGEGMQWVVELDDARWDMRVQKRTLG